MQNTHNDEFVKLDKLSKAVFNKSCAMRHVTSLYRNQLSMSNDTITTNLITPEQTLSLCNTIAANTQNRCENNCHN